MDRLLSMRVFERVVNEGGFAAAARALDMSPPVVTRLVADLEEHLGTRLLQRSTRRLSLTDAGQQYLSRVRNILQDIDEADAVAHSQTTELAGLLRLHAPPVLASYVIAPLLAEFRKRHPKILIDLEVASLHEPPIEDFDITLLGTDDSFDGDVVARKVIESEGILVASPTYLQRRGRPQRPEDLVQHDCLAHKMPNTRPRLWRMWCPENPTQPLEIEMQPVLLANHTDSLLRATLDGTGITSVAMDIVAPYLNRGELVRVLAPWITGRLVMYAALPSRKFIPQRTRVFLDFLVEETQKQNARAMAACTAC
ncbi:LysR family transcriptional regulator [Limnohabitans sp. TS-CS-82]|uniref:LysR family transcriptional regulator n=1 Tax=Limnohabitans sp. TS-CS-82 TaxID=2094193 RepID=UPI000CF26665|nr:LysR family transcriptional regulator [Limnohabitans sp. TS-CS-82]PQA83057.1 LysR family transcriptional regulator [Limnohabitans sp. TS-CS-82]